MSQRGPTLRYDVHERPPLVIAAGLGLQNALFVISGAILLPILLRAADLITAGEAAFLVSASLLTAGLSTAVQAFRVGAVGSGFMLFMGTSGTFFAATFDAIELAGIGFVAALALIAAPAELLVARFFRFFRNIFTPTVGGVVVMCVAVTVVPLTIQQWNGVGTDRAGSLEYMLIGGVAVFVMVAMIVIAPARYRLWSPIAGLAAGCVAAAITGDWSFGHATDAAIVGFPISEWEAPTFPTSGAAFAVLGAFVIATLAGTFETVGDAIAIQKVSLRNFTRIDYEAVRGALNADGVGNALAGVFCTTPNTTYSSPIGMVPVVGVGSRWVALWGAGIMVVMAFFPILSGFVLDLPGPAIGGVSFVAMLLLFIVGMRTVVDAGLNSRAALVVSLGFWGGFCGEFADELGLPFLEHIPDVLAPITGNAISLGSVIAVLVSTALLLIPQRRFRWRGDASTDSLEHVLAFGSDVSKGFNLESSSANRLELCLEELFTHVVENGDPGRTVRIEATANEDEVQVVVTDRSDVPNVELPNVPPDLLQADDEELQDLGLVLLTRLAVSVSHTTISGWQYVSFIIARQPNELQLVQQR
ncbi:MAG: purine/pyrimidine permease [Chloroflexi bacterium]|nr:purine/pyrimidine permease [Chloroflexota bacterium]